MLLSHIRDNDDLISSNINLYHQHLFSRISLSNGHVQVSQFEDPRARTYWSLSEKFGRYEIFVKENSSERRVFYEALLSAYVCTYYSIGLLEFCRSFPNWAEYIVNGPITNSFRTYPSEACIAELCSICNALERNRDDLFFSSLCWILSLSSFNETSRCRSFVGGDYFYISFFLSLSFSSSNDLSVLIVPLMSYQADSFDWLTRCATG